MDGAKLILEKDGDSEDISGHESLHRDTDKKLHISTGSGHFVIVSDSPIRVCRKDFEADHEYFRINYPDWFEDEDK